MSYNVDYNKLIVLLLPTFFRKYKIISFLRAAIAPLISMRYTFDLNRRNDHYELDNTWQKCFLQRVLNDRFDLSQRRIRIIEGDQYDRKYIYTTGEQKPRFLGTLFIRPSSDYSDKGYDFTIDMKHISADRYDIIALVKFYKLEGVRFNIINLPRELINNIITI